MSAKYTMPCAAALLVLAALPAPAQVVTHKDVSAHMAIKIIAAAVKKCEKDGAGLTIAVIGREGRLRGFLSADNAAPHHLELAQRKAYTALASRRSSEEWAKRSEPGGRNAGQRYLEHFVPLAGGFPIQVGKDTIGAVGVSGSETEPDPVCAQAGLAAVADELK